MYPQFLNVQLHTYASIHNSHFACCLLCIFRYNHLEVLHELVSPKHFTRMGFSLALGTLPKVLHHGVLKLVLSRLAQLTSAVQETKSKFAEAPLVAVLVPQSSSMAAVSKDSHRYHGKVTGAPQNSVSTVNGKR